jgi:hypothetical protein
MCHRVDLQIRRLCFFIIEEPFRNLKNLMPSEYVTRWFLRRIEGDILDAESRLLSSNCRSLAGAARKK